MSSIQTNSQVCNVVVRGTDIHTLASFGVHTGCIMRCVPSGVVTYCDAIPIGSCWDAAHDAPSVTPALQWRNRGGKFHGGNFMAGTILAGTPQNTQILSLGLADGQRTVVIRC